MINHHEARTRRLPPEILVEVASHLEDDASLVAATHVCHLWRAIFLSSHRLWSNLDFSNEERALAFLERAKSGPLSVSLPGDIDPSEVVKGSLNEVSTRVTGWWAAFDSPLDEIPMPNLEALEITDSSVLWPKKPIHLPSLVSFVMMGYGPLLFHTPLLTSFHLYHPARPLRDLLNFFRNCPLLEFAFISCETLDTHPASDEVVSLPLLRSFTHASPRDRYQLHLFDRLSLPSTCPVVLRIDVTQYGSNPWIPPLLPPINSSCLSDIMAVNISAHSSYLDIREHHSTFKIEFVDSTHRTITFDRISYHGGHPSHFSHRGFLDIPESIETGSVETLCFNRYPTRAHRTIPQVTPEYITHGLRRFRNLKTLILANSVIASLLGDISLCPAVDALVVYSSRFSHVPVGYKAGPDPLCQVQKFALSRKEAGTPLKTLTLVFPFAEPLPSELELLTCCVGRVEFVSGDDAVCWDVDKYLKDIQRNRVGYQSGVALIEHEAG